jgi:hypothetical protein
MSKYFMSVWNILWTFGIFYDHLVHFVLTFCVNLVHFFPVLVLCTKKNLATMTSISKLMANVNKMGLT